MMTLAVAISSIIVASSNGFVFVPSLFQKQHMLHKTIIEQSITAKTSLHYKPSLKPFIGNGKRTSQQFNIEQFSNPYEDNESQLTDGGDVQQSLGESDDGVAATSSDDGQENVNIEKQSFPFVTYVSEQVQNIPIGKIMESLLSPSGCDKVFDDFLGDKFSTEMRMECVSMFKNNKMELDLSTGECSGEYVVAVKGGEEQYADCPRITEFVVSLTRNLTRLLNEVREEGGRNTLSLEYELDENASIATIRTFNQKARLVAREMNLFPFEERRPFQYVIDSRITDQSNKVDYRKVTALYFLTPEGWNRDCGGGMTIKDSNGVELFVEAKNDRLVLFSSDRCFHRMEEWLGGEGGRDNGSVIVMNFVEKMSVVTDPNQDVEHQIREDESRSDIVTAPDVLSDSTKDVEMDDIVENESALGTFHKVENTTNVTEHDADQIEVNIENTSLQTINITIDTAAANLTKDDDNVNNLEETQGKIADNHTLKDADNTNGVRATLSQTKEDRKLKRSDNNNSPMIAKSKQNGDPEHLFDNDTDLEYTTVIEVDNTSKSFTGTNKDVATLVQDVENRITEIEKALKVLHEARAAAKRERLVHEKTASQKLAEEARNLEIEYLMEEARIEKETYQEEYAAEKEFRAVEAQLAEEERSQKERDLVFEKDKE